MLVITMFALAILSYPYLPDRMPTHWNAEGKVDGHMDKPLGAFLFPFIGLFLIVLFKYLPKWDPLRENYRMFEREYNLMVNAIIFYFFYIMLLILLSGLGYDFSMNYAMIPGMSLLFYSIGIVMEKAKRNWFVGIRTPWTMSSDKVWKKTHDKAAILYKACALVILLGFFFEKQMVFFILVPVLLVSGYLILYSYLEYKKEKKK